MLRYGHINSRRNYCLTVEVGGLAKSVALVWKVKVRFNKVTQKKHAPQSRVTAYYGSYEESRRRRRRGPEGRAKGFGAEGPGTVAAKGGQDDRSHQGRAQHGMCKETDGGRR